MPAKFDSKENQLITDFDDADDDLELKCNEGVMAKNEDLEQLQTSRRLLSKQQDELNADLENQSTSIEIDFTSPRQRKQLSAL